MEAKQRQMIVLGGLIVVLTMVVWWQFGLPASVPEPFPATGQTQKPAAAARGQVAMEVPLVAIALLEQPRSEAVDTGRDLFKFATRTRQADRGSATTGKPAGPGGGGAPSPAGPGVPAGAADTPAPPPPIALKFIGLVQKQGDPAKIAVLSDSRGVYHGREGDIIEGRYRIVRIGNESVELVYLDGRGRQVLRLSGA